MSREKEDYRINLEMLYERFEGKDFLMMEEVCAFLKCNRRTLLKDDKFPVKKVGREYRIPVTGFARWLS